MFLIAPLHPPQKDLALTALRTPRTTPPTPRTPALTVELGRERPKARAREFVRSVGLCGVYIYIYNVLHYSGLRVDGTEPNVGGLYEPPCKGHLEVCAIYSETTVRDIVSFIIMFVFFCSLLWNNEQHVLHHAPSFDKLDSLNKPMPPQASFCDSLLVARVVARVVARRGSALWCGCNVNAQPVGSQELCEHPGGGRIDVCQWQIWHVGFAPTRRMNATRLEAIASRLEAIASSIL